MTGTPPRYVVVFVRARDGARGTIEVADAADAHRRAVSIARVEGRAEIQYVTATGERQTLARYP